LTCTRHYKLNVKLSNIDKPQTPWKIQMWIQKRK
jgi:hypothetical protein